MYHELEISQVPWILRLAPAFRFVDPLAHSYYFHLDSNEHGKSCKSVMFSAAVGSLSIRSASSIDWQTREGGRPRIDFVVFSNF